LNFKLLGNGHINDTYLAQDDQGQPYVLQRVNTSIFKDPAALASNLEKICAFLQKSEIYPYHVPMPLSMPDGRTYRIDEAGQCWRSFPYFENTVAPERVNTVEEAVEAARAYAVFLTVMRDFSAHKLTDTIPGFHDTVKRWEQFEAIVAADPVGRRTAVQPELETLWAFKPLIEHIDALKRSGALPLRVVHNDTKAGNVLLDKTTGKAVAVIDLDTAMGGTVLSDFGDMVRTFVPSEYEDEKDLSKLYMRKNILKAVTQTFLSETESWLSKTERENLMNGARWIIAEQALRFLSDYLNGDKYYKTAYPEHNLVRAHNQLALLHLMEARL